MLALTASAQKREKYEFERNLPVYADSLIADLTFPLAWGNSDIRDFGLWKQTARQKVFDCMLTPPPPPAVERAGESPTQKYPRKCSTACLPHHPLLPTAMM